MKYLMLVLVLVQVCVLCLPGLAAAAADGRAIALHGNDHGALPCAACHGMNGAGNASIGAPALAGLPAPVIGELLGQFAQGQGGNAVMRSIAQSLSPDEMQALAAYYSGLPKL